MLFISAIGFDVNTADGADEEVGADGCAKAVGEHIFCPMNMLLLFFASRLACLLVSMSFSTLFVSVTAASTVEGGSNGIEMGRVATG